LTIVCDTWLPADGASAGTARLQSPQLVGMEVQKTLWSIETVLGDRINRQLTVAAALQAKVPPQSCSAADAALTRLEAAALALDEVAGSSGGNIPAAIVTEVFQRWQQEFNAAKTQLDVALAESAPTDVLETRRQSLLDSAAKVRQRLQPAVDALSQPELRRTTNSAPNLYALGPGAISELTVSLLPIDHAAPSRTLGTWSLALAAFGCWLLLVSRRGCDWLLENGRFLVAACGVAWWLLAPFGWLGWLFVLAALWLTIRPAAPNYAAEVSSTMRRVAPSVSR